MRRVKVLTILIAIAVAASGALLLARPAAHTGAGPRAANIVSMWPMKYDHTDGVLRIRGEVRAETPSSSFDHVLTIRLKVSDPESGAELYAEELGTFEWPSAAHPRPPLTIPIDLVRELDTRGFKVELTVNDDARDMLVAAKIWAPPGTQVD